ncbi:MAG: hydrogenase nickel incorporation protein HypB [Aquificota bacterium]|jgi:hydrogenase nickel incorporation protein HypB|nr:hydrogenase nickel incorporation protein HypB [Aquificaceae bacterium]HCO39443.1 hydrogenase accessory protein HypB [Aquificaceae bacterium]
MCEECGCSINHKEDTHKEVAIFKKVLEKNDHQAEENRKHFEEHGIFAINLMSSPGAGKTSLLERTIELLKDLRIGVIEGDLETDRDAQRIRAKGAPAVQISTGSACHLDAFMVHKGIHGLPLEELDLVFIENVGNLVCPASYDVGAHMNVVLLSVVEGDDKPEKYPVMFKGAQLMVITKIDLLPFVDFSIERAINSARKVNPHMDIIRLSAKTGEGMEDWLDYIRFKVKAYKRALV